MIRLWLGLAAYGIAIYGLLLTVLLTVTGTGQLAFDAAAAGWGSAVMIILNTARRLMRVHGLHQRVGSRD